MYKKHKPKYTYSITYKRVLVQARCNVSLTETDCKENMIAVRGEDKGGHMLSEWIEKIKGRVWQGSYEKM